MKADPPPLQLATPGERGKGWSEYPGGARSAHLASSPEGRSKVTVKNRMSTSLSVTKAESSALPFLVLFFEAPRDEAIEKREE